MSELIKRTIFGSIYVALVVTSLMLDKPYLFNLLFCLVASWATLEYYQINRADKLLTVSGTILTCLLFLSASSLLYFSEYFMKGTTIGYLCIIVYCIGFVLTLVSELFKKAENPIRNWGIFLSGQIMVALPFTLMIFIYLFSKNMLLALFIVIWLNDTGAYCTGKLIGKHKMFPRVSPGKSWEGLCGGAVVAMAVGYILFSDPFGLTGLTFSWWYAIILALAIVIFGTLGDLMESLLKRTLGIKDSGNVIPGHGGLLDRFDSIILAAPVVLILLLFFN